MENFSFKPCSLSAAEVLRFVKKHKPVIIEIKKANKKLCDHPLMLQISQVFGLWICVVSLELFTRGLG